MTAPISQPHWPLKCVLRPALAAIWLLYLTVCAQSERRGSWDELTEGSLPSLVSIVRGNDLLSPVYWLLFMSFIIPITFSLRFTSERRHLGGICVYKYANHWLGMDSLAHADLFVWQAEVASLYPLSGPWLSTSVTRHSGDKHQPLARSTGTNTSSRSQQITF